jgi:hypothetical protein
MSIVMFLFLRCCIRLVQQGQLRILVLITNNLIVRVVIQTLSNFSIVNRRTCSPMDNINPTDNNRTSLIFSHETD